MTTAHSARAEEGGLPVPDVLQVGPIDWVLNNSRLPVLVCRKAVNVGGEDPALVFEDLFQRNGWPPRWRDGTYMFHHYHAMARELLGFASGSAILADRVGAS
jgi:uncharacterized protein YjlB